MSDERTAEKGARCWRSECRTGCYYPDVCSQLPSAEKDSPVVQEGIRCSHGVQGPYRTAGEPIANCGERGVVVRRLLYADQTFTDWLELSAADLTRVFPPEVS